MTIDSITRKSVNIKYTSRDFESIRGDLVEYAKRYYSSTYRNFNRASFGAMVIDEVALVGDQLSFFADYAANESFLDTAIEIDNVIRLGKSRGYKYDYNPSSYGTLTFYIIIPANAAGDAPNTAYIPILRKGSTFSSENGNLYTLNNDVDFAKSSNEVVVAAVNTTTGSPTFYAIKAQGTVISGEMAVANIWVGGFERFRRVRVPRDNIAEIVSVYDSQGHEYYEVQNLSHDIILKEVPNNGSNRDTVHSIMVPVVAPRRFVVDRELNNFYLQFGAGSDSEVQSSVLPDPANVVLNKYGQDYISTIRIDPSNLVKSDKMGISPSNTNLRVIYRRNVSENVNVGAGALKRIVRPLFKFISQNSLVTTTMDAVINSLECINDDPIVGDVSVPTAQELRHRVRGVFSSQERAVTASDYRSLIYSMPSQFGAIKRCAVVHDSKTGKLRIFVIAEDVNGNFTAANSTLKNNLRTWIEQNKMLHDYIEIEDARIINVGVVFTAVADRMMRATEAYANCLSRLKTMFQYKAEIGEEINIAKISGEINKARGIVGSPDVRIVSLHGGNYSPLSFNINANKAADGKSVLIPKNCVYEVKYTGRDIYGTIR